MARTTNPIDDVSKVIVVSSSELLEFLEYEEALTKDKDTASRIRSLFIKLRLWDETDATRIKDSGKPSI